MVGMSSTVSWRWIFLSVDADCLGIRNGCLWIVTTHTDTSANIRKVNYLFEFSRNTQSWQCWHFILLYFYYMMDIVISYLNFNSKNYDKCRFVVELISLVNTFYLFSLEVVQKCQHCQLCVLWENSNVRLRSELNSHSQFNDQADVPAKNDWLASYTL